MALRWAKDKVKAKTGAGCFWPPRLTKQLWQRLCDRPATKTTAMMMIGECGENGDGAREEEKEAGTSVAHPPLVHLTILVSMHL